MATREVTLQINAGPSREELFDSLRLFDEGREVQFTVSGAEPIGGTMHPLFNAVQRLQVLAIETDLISEYWKLKLRMGKGDDWVFSPKLGETVIGHYDSRRRQGYLSYQR